MELFLNSFLLPCQSLSTTCIWLRDPLVKHVHLVQSNDEWALLLPQELYHLHSLYFKPVHEVYNYNGEITKCRTPRPQVGKGGMPWRVDDEHARNLDLEVSIHRCTLLTKCAPGKEGRAYLLSDATSLAFLYMRAPYLVQELGFASINMAQDAHNRRAVLAIAEELLILGLMGCCRCMMSTMRRSTNPCVTRTHLRCCELCHSLGVAS
mmetsp:Transcript_16022/g.36724  ORF Transcript_16022/g.36724 Transcript_16022/m.36724 type:complete len:208 (-) Transcript_16022:571-1194(-)